MDHKRHVMALYESAQAQDTLDDVLASIESFRHTLTKDAIDYFDSPLINIKEKLDMLKTLSYDPITTAWLRLVVLEKNMHEFHAFHKELTHFIRTLKKEIHIDVYVVKAILEKSQERLKDVLKAYFESNDITLHIHIDSTLVGGMKMMHQGLSFDQSIINRLDELKTVI